MNINMKSASALVLVTTGVGVAACSYVRTIKTERAKRRAIEENLKLDVTAIRTASDRMKARIENGNYIGVPLYKMLSDLDNMIQFEKIAIRSDL